jgi:hypothetical protein
MKYLWSRFLYRWAAGLFLSVPALILPRAAAAQTSPVSVYAGETAETPKPAGGVSAEFLWAGSWRQQWRPDEDGGLEAGTGNLSNREDIKVSALGLTARFQALDKRPALFWEHLDEGVTAFSGGIYHNPTGSRLLYGVLDEWGLSARLRNPWGKSLPFVESRRPLTADIKTEISSTRPPSEDSEAYLYLGSPQMGKFRAFASVQTDMRQTPAFGGGMDLQFARKTSLRAEGFYLQQRLAPAVPSTWFSFPPALPERDFRLGGAGIFFTTPFFGAAVDGACSETFAWGRDLYGNLAFRLGDKPWQVSAGADAAGSRFVDRDGSAVGAGFRAAARVDRKGKGSSLFRASLTLRGPEIGAAFNRGSAAVSYRFPKSLKFPLPFGTAFRPGRVSLSAARDGRNQEQIADSLDTGVSFYLGPVRTAFNAALTCVTDRVSRDFDTLKISGELSYYTGPFQFRAGAGYAGTRSKSPVWDLSWYVSIRGKREQQILPNRRLVPNRLILPGRFSVKVSSPDFPEKWACDLSWRLEIQTGKR